MKRQLIYHTHVNTSQSNKIAVKVQTESKHITCYLDRISRDGLTLSCDAETLHSIMPNKTIVAPKDPVSMSTTFTLDKLINASCRVIFARRLSKDQFVIELKFVGMDEQAMQHLDDYIEKTLRSASKHSEECKIPPQAKTTTPEVYEINDGLKITYSKVA